MTKLAMVVALVIGCGSKTDTAATAPGSGSAAGSGSGTGSGSSVAKTTAPPATVDAAVSVDAAAATAATTAPRKIEMTWAIRGRAMTAAIVDDAGPPEASKLVISGDGKDHVLVTTKAMCLEGEHAAQLVTGKKNTVLFRCETWDKPHENILADEWLIRWQSDKDFPTIYRHWRGARFARDPRWAGHRQWYPEQEVGDNDTTECCCNWEDEGLGYEVTSARYCKGSDDHHGVCVDAAKCKASDSEE